MKQKKQEKKGDEKQPYRSVKIYEKHYEIALANKKSFGTPIAFFIGEAIENLQKNKTT